MFSNSEQKLNDKKLEFLTYDSGVSLALEKVLTGHGDRIFHGPGPIIINFRETPLIVRC